MCTVIRYIKKKHVIALVIIAIVILYKMPTEINRNYKGYLFSYENRSKEKMVDIQVTGKLKKYILSENFFEGNIRVEEISMDVKSPIHKGIKGKFSGLKSKLKREPIILNSTDSEGEYTKTKGYLSISRDFDGISGISEKLREYYEDDSLVFIAPAENREQSEDILSNN